MALWIEWDCLVPPFPGLLSEQERSAPLSSLWYSVSCAAIK
ncbi:hypothetical protein Nmel_010850, partial [Mimus melanotis]